jgi:menaquinone-dependent protoporphyrinogen oxidase
MQSPILVAYITRSGSTAEVAEAIGKRLCEAGLPAEVAPMGSVKTVGERQALVLGAPLYMLQLPGEMYRFLDRNREAISALQTWFFVLGPIDDKPEQFADARNQAEKALAKASWFTPAELHVFGGKFDVNKMPFPMSLLRHLPAFPMRNMPAKDIRDWAAIRAWADGIAGQLPHTA